jgi:hypothetical protein
VTAAQAAVLTNGGRARVSQFNVGSVVSFDVRRDGSEEQLELACPGTSYG